MQRPAPRPGAFISGAPRPGRPCTPNPATRRQTRCLSVLAVRSRAARRYRFCTDAEGRQRSPKLAEHSHDRRARALRGAGLQACCSPIVALRRKASRLLRCAELRWQTRRALARRASLATPQLLRLTGTRNATFLIFCRLIQQITWGNFHCLRCWHKPINERSRKVTVSNAKVMCIPRLVNLVS